jgi:hypothetical protein
MSSFHSVWYGLSIYDGTLQDFEIAFARNLCLRIQGRSHESTPIKTHRLFSYGYQVKLICHL